MSLFLISSAFFFGFLFCFRNATISESEFAWIGDSAIASWGYTQGIKGIYGVGWDGTDGNHPRYNQIINNFVREIGIWEKQSSFYFQAKSCMNTIEGNIHFNGPRAGVNFNDGFGGGSHLNNNLILNTCRESGDHGPFNSWDRQVRRKGFSIFFACYFLPLYYRKRFALPILCVSDFCER